MHGRWKTETRPSIRIVPGSTIAFADLPDRSIALDGYVLGPAIDASRRRFSFDHHGNCVRLATGATCEQVRDALALGLDVRGMTFFLNHLDADGIVAAWLLLHPESIGNRAVRTWVSRLGRWDALGPALPGSSGGERFARHVISPLESMEEGSWLWDPDGTLAACLERVTQWFESPESRRESRVGSGRAVRVLSREGGLWVLEGNFGDASRRAYRMGAQAVLVVEGLRQGGWQYGIGIRSDLVDLPLPRVLETLAVEELRVQPGLDPSQNWGGGSSVGGSPRQSDGSSSLLDPARVLGIVRAFAGGIGVSRGPDPSPRP